MSTLAGNYQDAEPLMRETLELAREAMGPRSVAAASCVNNLAEVRVGAEVGAGADVCGRVMRECVNNLAEKRVGAGVGMGAGVWAFDARVRQQLC